MWGDEPRVESAWRSGHELGSVVSARLA
jgi:hypothetical protein